MSLQDLKNQLAKQMFGLTPAEAQAKLICVRCKEPIGPLLETQRDANEYALSALCPGCFEIITDGL